MQLRVLSQIVTLGLSLTSLAAALPPNIVFLLGDVSAQLPEAAVHVFPPYMHGGRTWAGIMLAGTAISPRHQTWRHLHAVGYD